ncbi:MAG: Zn-dependent hydrolase [Bacteroidales bacterium]
MNQNTFLPLLFAGILLGFQGCSQEEPINDLFAGNSPGFEISEEGSIRQIPPMSLFIRVMDQNIEYEGNLYPIELESEDEEQAVYSADFPLAPGLSVSAITFQKPDQILVLDMEGVDRKVELVQYDRLIDRKVNEFAGAELTADISHLSDNQKEMFKLLFRIADIMDQIYWEQVFPDREAAISSMTDEDLIRFFRINYGPWERLNGNLPFMPGYGPKPPGSGFYPADMTVKEFEALPDESKTSQYTLIRRDNEGNLKVIPYHVAYADQVEKASGLIRDAAELAEDKGFKKYLNLRADALLTDEYFQSDMAWMEMKENDIDFIVGPIENYEDALFNYKAAHESFILIKDKQWSERLAYISSLLPEMQKNLPVPEAYKQEVPGSGSDLGAYDAVYYAGDCNAGSKTIAINLPNDERVQAARGSRKLQLKNAIRYKFEKILVPISNVLIAEEQREHVTFDAFFENTMFHEVAHGLGLNQTINGTGTVRSALKEQYSALEEGKADILGLFLITRMSEQGLMEDHELMDNYVTFMASIFRSIRFGVASSHGKANMIRFYYFQEAGAFTKDPETGTYRIDFEQMQQAMEDLARMILTIQGDGDYEAASNLVEEKGFIREELQSELDRLQDLSIPVDIVFEQGPGQLGLSE